MPALFADMGLMGTGLGFAMLSLLLAVQHSVSRAELGVATSLNLFARSIGGAVGVAIMGAIFAAGLGGSASGSRPPPSKARGLAGLSPELRQQPDRVPATGLRQRHRRRRPRVRRIVLGAAVCRRHQPWREPSGERGGDAAGRSRGREVVRTGTAEFAGERRRPSR